MTIALNNGRFGVRRTIRIDNVRSVRYWAGLWGLTDRELGDAVSAVGGDPIAVASYLGKSLTS